MIHLIPKLRIIRAIPQFPHMPSWSARGQLYRLSLIWFFLVLQYQLLCGRDQNCFRFAELTCTQRRSDTIALRQIIRHLIGTGPNQIKFIWLSSTSGFSPIPVHYIYLLMSTIYPLSYGVPVRERYGSTLLPATREQHDQNCTQSP